MTKGLTLLLDAIAELPHTQLELVLHVIAQDPAEQQLLNSARARFADDLRVRFAKPLARAEVQSALSAVDALVVPSLWLETGPLVVYEAFAAGTPVLGTRRGGIAELVRDGIDGVLIAPEPQAWRAALARLAEEPETLFAMRANIQPPRSAREVAQDTAELYREVLGERFAA